MKIFQTFVTVMGVVMSLGYFPQAYKIWKSKSASSISIPSFIIFSIGTFTWFTYGVVIHDLPLIFSFVFGVAGSWAILALAVIYRNK